MEFPYLRGGFRAISSCFAFTCAEGLGKSVPKAHWV